MSARGWVAALACGLLSCGARSGLDVSATSTDAATFTDGARPDAFAPFPCTWTISRPLELDVLPCELSGAVHSSRAEVLIAVDQLLCDGTEQTSAWVVTLTDPPRVVVERSLPRVGGSYGALADHYVVLSIPYQVVDRFDARLEPVPNSRFDLRALGGEAAGFFGARVHPQNASLILGTVHGRHAAIEDPEQGLLTSEVWSTGSASTVHAPAWGWIFFEPADANGLTVRRDQFGRVDAVPVPGPPVFGRVPVAYDWLRPGAVALLSSGSLVRVSYERDPLAVETLLDAPARDAVLGSPEALATTEAEALLARRDGSIVAVPLSGGTPRALEVERGGAGIDVAAILLRPGTSVGGVFYSTGGLLRFRSFTCNR